MCLAIVSYVKTDFENEVDFNIFLMALHDSHVPRVWIVRREFISKVIVKFVVLAIKSIFLNRKGESNIATSNYL